MNSFKTFFDSFKEFIWDIIGYLLPGSFLIVLLSACIRPNFYFSTPLINDKNGMFPFVFVIISYLLGHLIFGFGILKESILGRFSYKKKNEKEVSQREAFRITKELMTKALLSKGINNNLSNASVRDIRNLAMSFTPESDQKVYTFVFRSELSNHTANICIVVGVIGLVFSIFRTVFIDLFVVDLSHVILYCLLILSYFLLCLTRDRFYAISIGLPFSVYSAKALQ